MKLLLDKTYKLRQRDEVEAQWFTFRPRVYVASQQAWWGKSATDQDLVVFAREINSFDVVEMGAGGADAVVCDCGAVKARTTHALWCSTVARRQ